MQQVDLYQPIISTRPGQPPLVLRVGVQSVGGYVQGGSPEFQLKPETYVLISALPQELQDRVHTAVQAIISGM